MSEFLSELESPAIFDESGGATTISPQQRPGASHNATDYTFVFAFLLVGLVDSSQIKMHLRELAFGGELRRTTF